MDDAVGKILDQLKKYGMEENTLVYFASDHGSHIDIGANGGSNGQFKGMNAWQRVIFASFLTGYVIVGML